VVNPFYPNQNRREFFKGAANGGVISSSEWPIMLSSALAATSAETSSEQFFRTSDSRTTTVKFNNYARGIGEIHGRQYYQWRIFVDEPAAQLISIEEVQYVLHRTFNEPFQISSRLRKNSLVHWAKPLESTIFVGISDMPQHGLFACPDRSKCDFRTSWRLFQTSKSTLRKRLKNVFPQPARDAAKQFELVTSGWGEFTILIAIIYRDGSQEKVRYYLDFQKPWPISP